MTELGEQILGPDGTGVVELLETLGEAITIRDPYDRIVYANRAALAQMGFDTLEELLSRPLGSIMDEYVVRDDQGRPLEMSDVPSVRLMKGEPVEPLLMHTIKRDTGESHWQLLKAAALRDPEGNMLAAITVIEDVTAVKTAEVYTSVLAESGRILASSLDYEQTLRNVAEAARSGRCRLVCGRSDRRGPPSPTRRDRAPGSGDARARQARAAVRARGARSRAAPCSGVLDRHIRALRSHHR